MTPGRCYIAGPMRGRVRFNFPAFYTAEADLKARGWQTHNPARHDIETIGGFNPDVPAALRHDVEVISTWAEAVIVLDGWQESEGARLEVAVAQAIGIPVYTIAGDVVTETVAARVVTR